jgi:hypothetical protein
MRDLLVAPRNVEEGVVSATRDQAAAGLSGHASQWLSVFLLLGLQVTASPRPGRNSSSLSAPYSSLEKVRRQRFGRAVINHLAIAKGDGARAIIECIFNLVQRDQDGDAGRLRVQLCPECPSPCGPKTDQARRSVHRQSAPCAPCTSVTGNCSALLLATRQGRPALHRLRGDANTVEGFHCNLLLFNRKQRETCPSSAWHCCRDCRSAHWSGP